MSRLCLNQLACVRFDAVGTEIRECEVHVGCNRSPDGADVSKGNHRPVGEDGASTVDDFLVALNHRHDLLLHFQRWQWNPESVKNPRTQIVNVGSGYLFAQEGIEMARGELLKKVARIELRLLDSDRAHKSAEVEIGVFLD